MTHEATRDGVPSRCPSAVLIESRSVTLQGGCNESGGAVVMVGVPTREASRAQVERYYAGYAVNTWEVLFGDSKRDGGLAASPTGKVFKIDLG